jgi:asparagine synthase (glutamine-hydrolysing)
MYFDEQSRYRLLSGEVCKSLAGGPLPEEYKASLCLIAHTLLQQATAVDFRSYLVDQILVKVDRASMLSSLEIRAPWLDYRIIEFAFGHVPDILKATGIERKVLPQRLAERLLPPGMDLKRKQGFSMPLAAWFKGDWGAYIESILREADPGLFDPRAVRKLIVGQRHGLSNTQRLFALTMFELWRREYRVTVPV